MTDTPRLPRGVLINASLVAVVAAGGGIAYAMVGSDSSGNSTSGRTVAVQRGDVTAQVSASGNVTLPAETQLSFNASGNVTEVDVKPGDKVKAGQVLAKVDPTQANQQLSSAQAALTTAQAQLAKLQQGQTPQQQALAGQQLKSAGDQLSAAKTSYSDAQANISADAQNLQAAVDAANATLASDQANQASNTAKIAQDQAAVTQAVNAQKSGALKDSQALHQASASLTSAQNSYNTTVDQQAVAAAPATPDQLASAQQSVTNAQNNLATAQKAVAGAVITAPSDATVLSVAGGVGTAVTAGSSSSSSSSSAAGSSSSSSSSSSKSSTSGFIVLGDLTQLTVTAEFAETDAAKLKAGEQANVSINAVPGSAFTATVQSVDPTSTVVSNVVEYGVVLQFGAGQQGLDALKLGQTASVSVTTDSVTNVLYVPSSSIVTAGGQTTVTVVSGKTQTVTPVTVGVTGDSTTEIQSGLNEGDQVLLSPRSLSGSTSGGSRGGGIGGVGGGIGGGGVGGGRGFGG